MADDTVTGWDTAGVTGLALLSQGRVKLEFTGLDGQKQNVLIPASSIPALVATLIPFNAEVAKATGVKDEIAAGTHLLGVKSFAVGSDDSGQQFIVAMTTGDGLELRFLLNAANAEALAAGLALTLAEHGRTVPPLSSGRLKH